MFTEAKILTKAVPNIENVWFRKISLVFLK